MNRAKLWHWIQIAVMLSVTVCISFILLRVGRTLPVSAPVSTSVQTTLERQPETSEPQPQTEWIPQIEYDTYTPSEIAREHFCSTVILGNSQAQALSNFGLIRDADFVTRIGLSINGVLTSKTGDAPITDLYGKQYEKAVFIFGENELGWPYPENFIAYYKKVINKVRELNPGVEVYCQAIFPVSAKCSETSTTGITNENVRIFNGMIEKMCEEIGAHFMPVSDAFFDHDGVLPADAATDGVHFGYNYCKIWAGDLSAYLAPAQQETTELTETPEVIDTTEEGVTLE